MDATRNAALKSWLGYGNWKAKYWFAGMEPDGDDDPETYASWSRLGASDLIDLREHNVDWNARVAEGIRTHWFDEKPRVQCTWACLIRLLLAFEGRETDVESVRSFQANRWGTLTGPTLLVELSAAAAVSTGHDVNGRGVFAAERSEALSAKLHQESPDFVVFYGATYREAYARIVGEPFDSEGFSRAGPTLCVLTPHPRVRPSAGWWTEKGKEIRAKISRCLRASKCGGRRPT